MAQSEDYRDKGFAWLILLVSFLTVCIEGSIIHAPQLYILEYQHAFNVSGSIVGLPGGVHAGIHDLASLPIGVFVTKFGCKISGVISGVLIFIGLFLSSFAPNIYFLILTYGVIASIGSSMAFSVALVMTHEYFEKYKGFASSVLMSGYAVNFIAFVPLLQLVIEEFGWRGSHAIHAAFAAHLIAFSLLFRKPTSETNTPNGKININSDDKENIKKNSTSVHTVDLEESQTSEINYSHPKRTNKLLYFLHEFYNGLDFSLFKSIPFVLFLIACVFATLIDEMLMQLLVTFMNEKGISKLNGTFVISIMGISSLISRIIFGIIASCKCTDVILLKGICVILMSLSAIAFTFVITYEQIIVVGLMIGISMAGVYAVKMYSLDIIIGKDKLAVANGWLLVLQSISTMSCLPMSGLFYDITGSWKLAFYVGSLLGVIGGLLLSVISCLLCKEKKSEV